ncbi:MAG: hypothetical protein EZS28_034870, partial [Streblomastix strix]
QFPPYIQPNMGMNQQFPFAGMNPNLVNQQNIPFDGMLDLQWPGPQYVSQPPPPILQTQIPTLPIISQQPIANPVIPPGWPPPVPQQINLQILAQLPPDDQKQYIGEFLYTKISTIDEPNAGKITGMLLELDIDELINLLGNDQQLNQKTLEAQKVIHEAGQQQIHHSPIINFDLSLISNGTDQEKKDNIGEFIYEYVARDHEDLAGKITGLILELDLSELKQIVQNKQLLNKNIADAIAQLGQNGGGDAE